MSLPIFVLTRFLALAFATETLKRPTKATSFLFPALARLNLASQIPPVIISSEEKAL